MILLGKPMAALAIVRLLGYPLRTAASVAVALAQIGEFSFILAAAGKHLGILDDRAVNTIVAGAIITITLNPLLYRLARPLGAVLGRFIKEPAGSDSSGYVATLDAQAVGDGAAHDRAIIVGYGPVGRTLARLLRENQIEPVIIELNLETVRRLATEGIAAVYGDVAHRETLERAGLKRCPRPDPQQLPDDRHARGDPPGARAEPAGLDRRPLELPPRAAGAPGGGRGPRVLRRGRGRLVDDRVPARAPRGDSRADRPRTGTHPVRAVPRPRGSRSPRRMAGCRSAGEGGPTGPPPVNSGRPSG